MPISKKDWNKEIILSRAKDLAWEELDKHDQRIYLSEAEKKLNKEKICQINMVKEYIYLKRRRS